VRRHTAMTLAMRTTMTRATVTVTRGRPTTTMTRATPVRARGDDATTTRSRRDALASMGLLCASVAFAARANEDDEEEGGKRKKRVVITGSNSGIGLDAAKKLAASGEWTVALACRTRAEAEAAKREIFEYSNAVADDDVECYGCDLASLESVRAFAREVRANGGVDALALNAGVEYSGDPVVHRTKENFEETVGVNHLGHFLLANMLLDELEKSSETHPRIVVTASEVHDPASPGGGVGKGATLGDLSGIETQGAAFEMASGEEFDADKAYKDSKLMNLLFTYELERRLRERNSKITVNAFGPGLITRTGLFRNQNPLFVKVFDFAVNNVFHVAETVSGGGDCLVFMLTDPSLGGDRGGLYYNNTLSPGTPPTGHAFVPTESSKESNDVDEARRLWALSESLVGL